jgi:deaminated glutathione amidase
LMPAGASCVSRTRALVPRRARRPSAVVAADAASARRRRLSDRRGEFVGTPSPRRSNRVVVMSSSLAATGAETGAETRPKVAVGQMCATDDVEANFRTCEKLATLASDAGCAMLFLPECFAFIGRKGEDALAIMEPLDGPLMTRYRDLARAKNIWLSLGGFPELGPDAGHRLNAHVLVDTDGEIRASYRKIHLFDVDVPNGPLLMESKTASPGSEIVAADSPIGRLGMMICYDLRFPELFSALRYECGARVMLVPSAFTRPTGAAHWEVLLRARAIETQSYVIAAAQCGVHSEGRASYGHSIIVDPWGEVIAKLDDPDEGVGIAVAEIDLRGLEEIRAKMPIETHRRGLGDRTAFPVTIAEM